MSPEDGSDKVLEAMSIIDPSYHYAIVAREFDKNDVSIFAGFSRSLIATSWAMEFICYAPTNVTELTRADEDKFAQRIAGVSPYRVQLVGPDVLSKLQISWERPFWIIISSDQYSFSAVQKFCRAQTYPPLHVSSMPPMDGTLRRDEVTFDVLKDFALKQLTKIQEREPSAREMVRLVRAFVSNWSFKTTKLNRARDMDPCVSPNYFALQGVGYRLSGLQAPEQRTDYELVTAMLSSMEELDRIRSNTQNRESFRAFPPTPDLVIFAPALLHGLYISKNARKIDDALGEDSEGIVRALQRQTGYTIDFNLERPDLVTERTSKSAALYERAWEIQTHTGAVAINAARHLAPTIRLPFGVNRCLNSLRKLADHARSDRAGPKLPGLFRAVQDDLLAAIDARLMARISQSTSGIKLVCDAPLEWLPVDDVPLCIRHDVTRIPATPGNLSMSLLIEGDEMDLPLSAFNEILYVDAIEEGNSIFGILSAEMKRIEPLLEGVAIRHERPRTVDEFVEIVNSFSGACMLFDGHGSHETSTNIGEISIQEETVDVWKLVDRMRSPPIVILSACDTHAIDRSHATSANGFLMLGAKSVIATLLPIDARDAARYAARFILRLSRFLPAALIEFERSMRWHEVVGGVTRSELLTDIAAGFEREDLISTKERMRIVGDVANEINRGNREWYQLLHRELAEHSAVGESEVRALMKSLIVGSDAIRYIHLGGGERIVIESEHLDKARNEIMARFGGPS
jgi:hypothetical protein